MAPTVKPAFFEKGLMDFYQTFLPFEKESTSIGDPFGVNEIKSFETFNKQLKPVTYASVISK